MPSFFPGDYAIRPGFTCADCNITATVSGEGTFSLMRRQAERCTERGHDVTLRNFTADPAGQDGDEA